MEKNCGALLHSSYGEGSILNKSGEERLWKWVWVWLGVDVKEGKGDRGRETGREGESDILSITLNRKFNMDNWNSSVFKVYQEIK